MLLAMYGLILEGVRQFICSKYGEDHWNSILRSADIDVITFGTHEVYGETLIPNIIESASRFLNMTIDEIMYLNGIYFINFVSQYGYDGILRVLGRDLRDFLNGLDNLHEYLRFSYPKLKPPSFFCVNESKTGITLQYRTRRSGYIHYVRGQITEIARQFYNTEMSIEIVSQTSEDNVSNCIMRLHFNNKNFIQIEDLLPVPSEVFFEVFPFNIVFNRGMRTINCGKGMLNALPDLPHQLITEYFLLTRPLIEFTWDAVMLHTNNIFELIHLDPKISSSKLLREGNHTSKKRTLSRNYPSLKMRGQMKYMPEWDAIVFLGTPIMRDVESMYKAGLFINDLSMHDSSRDLVLAGEQQSAELKLALEQESEKSKKLEESLQKLDELMKKTDELLFQMIPKSVAERLRHGSDAVDTCEHFDEVTILFSDVVGFTTICSKINPFDVVEMLNKLYSVFDELTEKHKVYKVETIGDAYMIASGCPTVTQYHGPFIIEMSLDMIKSIGFLMDPSDHSKSLQIRVGIHTGMVVAGVVGLKMPRYCLFGDTVNTASRMESNSEPQKIHISEATRSKVTDLQAYKISERGHIDIKGKGNIKTYWLEGHNLENPKAVASLMTQLERERITISDSNLAGSQIKGDGWESLTHSRASSARSRTGSILELSYTKKLASINHGDSVPGGPENGRSIKRK